MRPIPLRRPLRLGLAWLLGLALLLPAAQFAAAWHGVSHLRAAAGVQDEGKSAPGEHCGLCLVASALGGVGLPSASQAPAAPDVRDVAPAAPVPGVRLARPAPAYRSRAPPSAPR